MTHKRKKGDGMERLLVWIEHISDWLWGPPLIILLTGTGLYFTILLKGFQFRYPLYIFKQGKKPKGEGTVTPLFDAKPHKSGIDPEAFSEALS
ncbi:Hypothetical protein ACI5QM_00808 [Bacillus subtilis]